MKTSKDFLEWAQKLTVDNYDKLPRSNYDTALVLADKCEELYLKMLKALAGRDIGMTEEILADLQKLHSQE